MKKTARTRLDLLVLEQGLVPSREKAQQMIRAGLVRSGDKLFDKPGMMLPSDTPLELKHPPAYVSRGGTKLEGFLKNLKIDVTGFHCLDIGASTGGFTDCLLQHGASHVTCVDVGHGILHWRLRKDPRVRVIEKTNARYLEPGSFDSLFDLVVVDVSFISLKLILPVIPPSLKLGGYCMTLVKPQFEAGREHISRGGVVTDPRIQEACVSRIKECGMSLKLLPLESAPACIQGPKGNQEYLILFRKG